MGKTKRIYFKDGKLQWICLGDKCPKNCCGPFGEEPFVYASVFGIERKEIPILEKEAKELAKKFGKESVYRNKKDNGWYLALADNLGTCCFFKSGRCTIYIDRPSTCKAYPFYFDKFMGLCVDKTCHGVGKGETERRKVKEMYDSLCGIYDLHKQKALRKLQ